MPNALIIHGWAHKDEYYDPQYPTESNSHWLPWLSKQLMMRDIHTVAVEMPGAYYPVYEIWKKEFERYDIGPETILIGHSCGAGFLVRWLSENSTVRAKQVILVAPWLGDDPDQDFDETFFDFVIDKTITGHADKFTIFNSSNDDPSIQKSVTRLKQELPDFKYIELDNKGHFTLKGMGTEEFRELLEEVTS